MKVHRQFTAFAQRCGLGAEGLTGFLQQYPPDASRVRPADVPALRAPRLARLLPSGFISAEDDVLRDEGEALAVRAGEHGVAVPPKRAAGMHHGFFEHAAASDQATRAIVSAGIWRRAVRATTEDTSP